MNASLLATVNFVALLLLLSFLAAAVARARWQGHGNGLALVLLVLAGQVWFLPQVVGFFVWREPRLLYPLWFGDWIVTAAAAFLLPLVFQKHSRALSDAARLDGAGAPGIFRLIVWPAAWPALLALALLLLMTTWTEFAQPIFAAMGNPPTPAFADCTFPTAPGELAILAASSLVASLPALALYLFARARAACPAE